MALPMALRACCSAFCPSQFNLMQAGALVMLYNLLAFAAQPLFGYAADRLNKPRLFRHSAGLACIVAAMLIAPLSAIAAVVIAGAGSGLFHVGGGALTFRLRAGQGQQRRHLASPGVLGLALGGAMAAASVFPFIWIALSLAVMCGLILVVSIGEIPTSSPSPQVWGD